MAITAGTRLNRYEILAPLGAGGMGEVYLARDTQLDRKVALKLLPERFTQDPDRLRRFIQEAKAVSALNHPNIVTIHEIGSVDGAHFMATEFVEGQTLRQQIAHARLETSTALEIAVQVTSALMAAHEAGIIHRDIKPDNIMLRRDGYVKVLDFGLAKLTEPLASSVGNEAPTLFLGDTNPGTVLGTVTYMSPEQARGLKVDARTDIFSLGVVLYEMITGRVPFTGATMSDVLVSILERDPLPLSNSVSAVPPELERIVAKALVKDREARYQTARDLFLDLKRLKQQLDAEAEVGRSGKAGWRYEESGRQERRWQGNETVADTVLLTGAIAPARPTLRASHLVSGLKRHKSGVLLVMLGLIVSVAAWVYFLYSTRPQPINAVAVLPFVNVTGDPNTEHISDSVTQSIIKSLSRLPGLSVKSFSSVLRFKGQTTDPQRVGRELEVPAVLTGRITQHDDELVVSIELVNARDNSFIWGEQYRRKFADVLLLQEELTRDISEKLRLKLSSEGRKQLEAYQLYLKGRHFWNKRTLEGLKQGVEYFQQVIDRDPNYAPAYAGLADCYNMLVLYGALSPKEGFPKAKAAAIRALEIDDTLAEAHTSLAYALFRWDWDWQAAEREFKRAIELSPNYAVAHQWYSNLLLTLGRADEAIAAAKRAQELDPLSLITSSQLAWILYHARQYDRAIEQAQKTIELAPNFFAARRYLGLAYEQQGRYEEAIAQFQRGVEISNGALLMKAHLGHAYAVAGKKEMARQVLGELLEQAKRSYVSPYLIAVIYAGLGEQDLAFEWLERAYEERAEFIVYLRADPRLDPLRSEVRFSTLAQRMGLIP